MVVGRFPNSNPKSGKAACLQGARYRSFEKGQTDCREPELPRELACLFGYLVKVPAGTPSTSFYWGFSRKPWTAGKNETVMVPCSWNVLFCPPALPTSSRTQDIFEVQFVSLGQNVLNGAFVLFWSFYICQLVTQLSLLGEQQALLNIGPGTGDEGFGG